MRSYNMQRKLRRARLGKALLKSCKHPNGQAEETQIQQVR